VLNRYLGTYRFIYNKCVELDQQIQKHNYETGGRVRLTQSKLRNELLNSNSPLMKECPWLSEIGYNFRDEACRDYLKAKKTSITLLRNKRISQFKMRFKSKKDRNQSFGIVHKDWGRSRGKLAHVFSSKHMAYGGVNDLVVNKDTTIIRDQLGRWWICMLFNVEQRDNQAPIDSIIALDPGHRTFMTGYDPKGKAFEFARYDFKRVFNLCRHLDTLESKYAKSGKKKTIKKALKKHRHRIKNLIVEVHRKVSLFLVRNYRTILLPKFETQQMVMKKGRKRRLFKSVARNLMVWSHYAFKQRLKSKAEEYGSQVIDCTEEYTSKTCTNCGHVANVSGKTKRCPSCKVVVDRDIGAARNILMKFLTEKVPS